MAAVAVGNMVPSSSSSSSIRGAAARNKVAASRPPPLFTSTNPTHVDVLHLRDLFSSANLSCHRFPILDANGCVEPVDPHKLRIALSHSSVVVSVFSKQDHQSPFPFSIGFPFPVMWTSQQEWSSTSSRRRGQLVGFGRAVSDNGLTASIHDLVVLPSLQGLGIGKMIVNRIIRVLTSRGIYDISALCSEKERNFGIFKFFGYIRLLDGLNLLYYNAKLSHVWMCSARVCCNKLFFEACGFGEDILESTTMIYTKAPFQQKSNGDEMVVSAGRKMLLVPALKKHSHLR